MVRQLACVTASFNKEFITVAHSLRAGIAGFEITPRIHPKHGAWGTTPSMTEIDLPLLSRCIALEQGQTRLVWFGSDLVGDTVADTDALRDEVAAAVGMSREQVIWSTSQTHSSGARPGSRLTGCSICEVSENDQSFAMEERQRLMRRFIDGARCAIDQLQDVRVSVGHGYCDSMSYNTRLPMPNGGVKFSRHHAEGLQGCKFFDPTIGLLRFDDLQGKPLGGIFNFSCHPATMINGKSISPDWVGTARKHIEDQLDGKPVMFVQGMCGDVNCYHIFGTPLQAKRSGDKIGQAAVAALPYLVPVRGGPLILRWHSIDLHCRPMYTHNEIDLALDGRHAFIDELQSDPTASWFCGVNLADFFSVDDKIASVKLQIQYLQEASRILATGEPVRSSLSFTCGALRIGDVVAFLSPGENFAATGRDIRQRSPFAHSLVCGDTNGLFGYIGDDDEIDRGGYETDSFWKMLLFDDFRLAPAKGSVQSILKASHDLFTKLR
jgi:neutral ceramidase